MFRCKHTIPIVITLLFSTISGFTEDKVYIQNQKLKQEMAKISAEQNKVTNQNQDLRDELKNITDTGNYLETGKKPAIKKVVNKQYETVCSFYTTETLVVENHSGKEKVKRFSTSVAPGKKYLAEVEIKSENLKITNPNQKPHISNIRFNFYIKDEAGKQYYPGAKVGAGTFDWNKFSFTFEMPLSTKNLWVCLGLRDATGKVSFRNLVIKEIIKE